MTKRLIDTAYRDLMIAVDSASLSTVVEALMALAYGVTERDACILADMADDAKASADRRGACAIACHALRYRDQIIAGLPHPESAR